MGESYTFSRALHMMRYGGKKMRSELDGYSIYFYIQDGVLCMDSSKGKGFIVSSINAHAILGSWTEVKE